MYMIVYDSACQLLNNLLEMQDSQLEMSRKPLLFGDVLSAEEDVLGCMCDLFRSWAEKKETIFQYQRSVPVNRMGFFRSLSKKDRSTISFYCV